MMYSTTISPALGQSEQPVLIQTGLERTDQCQLYKRDTRGLQMWEAVAVAASAESDRK